MRTQQEVEQLYNLIVKEIEHYCIKNDTERVDYYCGIFRAISWMLGFDKTGWVEVIKDDIKRREAK